MIERINNDEVLPIIEEYFHVKNPFTIYSKTIVYKDNNQIVGILIYDEIYDRIEIDYILVIPTYKRKGIGSILLKNLDNNKSMSLEVRESNISAIEFYKKNGFVIVSRRKNYYHNEDGLLMCREALM